MYLLKLLKVDIYGKTKYEEGLNLVLNDQTDICCLDLKLLESLKVEVKFKINGSAQLNKIKGIPIYKAIYTNDYQLKDKDGGSKEIVLCIGEKNKIDGYILFISCFYTAKTSGIIIVGNSYDKMVVVLKEGEEIEFTTLENKNEMKKILEVINNQLYLSV